jgi:release factor glutamine methyltransferase
VTYDEAVIALRAAGCVWAEDEARLLLAAGGDLDALVARRCGGEPVETVVGWAEFCGVRIACASGVFVPRRRSELLVRTAVEQLADGRVVIDLCCGTGAVGAVLQALVGAEVHACDIDPAAVACARRNLERVYEGDLYAALPAGLCADVIVANAPYVPTSELAFLPIEAREHEHRVALDGGADGLDVHRRVAAGARERLRPGGRLLIEVSDRQSPAAQAIFAAAGLAVQVTTDDDLGATVVIGTA